MLKLLETNIILERQFERSVYLNGPLTRKYINRNNDPAKKNWIEGIWRKRLTENTWPRCEKRGSLSIFPQANISLCINHLQKNRFQSFYKKEGTSPQYQALPKQFQTVRYQFSLRINQHWSLITAEKQTTWKSS